jgi:hypothetical protein
MRRRRFFSTDTENPVSFLIRAERESGPSLSSTIFRDGTDDGNMVL